MLHRRLSLHKPAYVMLWLPSKTKTTKGWFSVLYHTRVAGKARTIECANDMTCNRPYKVREKLGGATDWSDRSLAVYAGIDYPDGVVILPYWGAVCLSRSQYVVSMSINNHQTIYIDTSRKGSDARYVNNSCKPNLNFQELIDPESEQLVCS